MPVGTLWYPNIFIGTLMPQYSQQNPAMPQYIPQHPFVPQYPSKKTLSIIFWGKRQIVTLDTHSIQHSPSWEANRFAASQEIPCIFMEPEGSLPYSQVPATCLYPEPTPSSPNNPLQLPKDPS
jgi:hypothetical protein